MKSKIDPVPTERVAFASLISAAYASAGVALLFLVLDAARGNPLFTPSLLGSVVLLGEAPSAASPVRLDMVALYSLVHLGAFALLGTGAALLHARRSVLRSHPVLLAALLFAALGAGAAVVDSLLFPGLIGAIGTIPASAANALSSGIMTWLIHRSIAGEEGLAESPIAIRSRRPPPA